jgi:PAS domain S-box-containing protein
VGREGERQLVQRRVVPDHQHRADRVVHGAEAAEHRLDPTAVEGLLEMDLDVAREHREERSERLAGAQGGRAEDELGRDPLAPNVLGDQDGGLSPRAASGRSRSARSGSSRLDSAWRRMCNHFTKGVFSRESRANREGHLPFQAEFPSRVSAGQSQGSQHNEERYRLAALGGPRRRPQSRPYLSRYERSLRPCLEPPSAPSRRIIIVLGALNARAARPSTRVRLFLAIVLGVGLEGLVMLLGDWHDRYPGAAVAAGVLAAAFAGAFGGIWGGLIVAGAGWTLHFFFVADQSLRALIALPAWLAVAALAGWLASSRRRVAQERRLISGELSAVRDSAAEAIIGIDREGTIVSWNAGAEALYGYDASEAIGQPISRLAPKSMRTLAALRAGERLDVPSTEHRHKDGGEIAVSLTVVPTFDGMGGLTGAVLAARDVGEPQRAEARERETEAKYRALTEHLPTITYVHPLADRGTPLYVSPQAGSILGYAADELLAKPNLFFQLVHEDDRERVSAEIDAAAAGAGPLRSEYRMLSRDGRVVWVRDEATTVRDDDGKPLYVQGYLLDVSERRTAGEQRESLLAAERAAAAEALDRQRKLDVLARAGEILASSPNYQATLRRVAELAVQDLADWCVVDLIDDDGAATRLAAAHSGPGTPPGEEPGPVPEPEVLEVARCGKPELSETRMCVPLRARGRTLGALTLLTRAPGRSYGADDLSVAQDLAGMTALTVDNARLTREVEESADAAQVLTYVADGVVLVDQAGTIRLWNPAAEAITGLTPGEVLGRAAADVIAGWKALADRIPVGAASEPVEPEAFPLETARGERWISISGVDFFGGIVYAFRDVTDARRLEELKADFVTTASHELRTPLAAVYGAAQTLRRHDFALDEAGRNRFVSLIVEESDRLNRIVNEILLANQLDAGRLDLVWEPFDAGDLVERVVESFRGHGRPEIRFETLVADSTPLVAADRDRVRQVLVNLVENATKYSPDGGLVQVGVRPAEGSVCFYVRDEGLGIPADEQSRIFEKFYRLDPEMTRGIGGTGLGLYICRELLERMGGRIWVESQEGVGSIFSFELPAAEPAVPRPAGPGESRELSDALRPSGQNE